MNRCLFRDDPAFLTRRLFLVTLDHIDAAYQRAASIGTYLDHFTGAALVAAGEHRHLVALLDLRRHYSTSGASLFFSSRRRPTSWPRDWSSDVCSSDLTSPRAASPATTTRSWSGTAAGSGC